MFECHACLRRYIRALISTPLSGTLTRQNRTGRTVQSSFRTVHTDAIGVKDGKQQEQLAPRAWEQYRGAAPSTTRNAPNWRDSPELRARKTAAHASLKQSNSPWTKSSEYRNVKAARVAEEGPKSKRLTQENIGTELKYLKDPLKLADHVRYTLDRDDEAKAMALVRVSSKGLANTVSWNHMIDWQMSKGYTKRALETYNEMKKRGQKPDSHTYLLLLRGLADHAHYPHTLGSALTIYHSMTAPNSKVGRNIIHTNAMLKVCARANDMDSMWDIASKLPETGSFAANSWTFTTILNSMRMHALVNAAEGESPESCARRREDTIVEGRRLWGPVITRWRQGDLMLDEELVCAMGRLLLIGARPRDWDDVLSLVQQSMNIPRLVPRLGSAAREESALPRIRAPNTPKDMKNDASDIVDEHKDSRPSSEFDAFEIERARTIGQAPADPALLSQSTRSGSPNSARGDGRASYVRPGNNTLSLITETCLKMAAKRPARDYWDLLTDRASYGLVPDSDNVHVLLRVLRQSRSSAEAATLLCDEMPRLRLQPLPKSFRIAMSTCVRDIKNPHVLEHAGRILDFMQRELEDADAKTLSMYLEVAREIEDPGAIARALERLEPSVVNLRSLVNFARSGRLDNDDRALAGVVFRGMIACYDRVLKTNGEAADDTKRRVKVGNEGAKRLTEAARKMFIERRSKLAAFVTRTHEKERGQSMDWRSEQVVRGKRVQGRSERRYQRPGNESVQTEGLGISQKRTPRHTPLVQEYGDE